ncbi:MAG TPA: ABC transporter ATP-binding protein [Trueperaceae bacterium]
MSSPLLEVDGLDAGYGSLQILFGVDLQVADGESVLVFGPNGAGKSTLLKALLGLARQMGGGATLAGEPLAGLPPERIVRLGLGYVPQIDNVFRNMSVEENLDIGSMMLPRAQRRRRRAAILDLFPILAQRRRQQAGTLSGGQRQMLAMARALLTQPGLLLLDEPSAGLSPQAMREMFATIRRISEVGTAILMVEQNSKQALEYVDRGYVLENGRVRFEGAARELLERRDIAELYLGVRRKAE